MNEAKLIQRIVVGVDGSEAAGEALLWSIALAHQTGAEIVAVFAVSPPNSFEYIGMAPVLPAEFDPVLQAELQQAFEQDWSKPLAGSGVKFRTVFSLGHPASVIAALAEVEDADLVVVGRRGRGGIAELMLGSVSHELSHHCSKPVLLISHHKGARTESAPVAAGAASRG